VEKNEAGELSAAAPYNICHDVHSQDTSNFFGNSDWASICR
jgi:hypothetical protein